jgi:HsdM-like protein
VGWCVTNPVTYIEQLSYLTYLKLLDEEELSRELQARLLGENGNAKLLFPKQAERYRWSQWRFKSGTDLRDYVRDQVFPYMASLVKDVDLLIVVSEPFGPEHSRFQEINRVYQALSSFRIPNDVLLYSSDEFAKWSQSLNHVVGRCSREGKLLYAR